MNKFQLDEELTLEKFSKMAKFNTTMVENMQTLSSMNNYYKWLASVVSPHVGKKVLDVGCANGNLSQFFLDRSLVGIDISKDYLKIISERFKNARDFKTHLIDASNPKEMAVLKKYKFDTAITMNVFEHIKDDVSAFKNVFQVLEPGAKFIVIVPAMKQLYAILDYEGGHFRRYNRKDLTSRLKAAGFNIIRSRYINVPGAVGWFINYTLLKKKLFAKGTFGLYNTLVPLFKLTETIVKFPFGMSVIAIAQKPKQI